MSLPIDILHRTPTEAVRRIVASRLDRIRDASIRLDDPEDIEALHDFRVAVRQLRSIARAWRGELEGILTAQELKSLKKLQRATGQGRDCEVLCEWIDAHRDGLSEDQAEGVQWMFDQLVAAKQAGYRKARPRCRRWPVEVGADIATRVETLDLTVDLRLDWPATTFADALAESIERHFDDMAELLAQVCDGGQRSLAHEARIAGKRLRYQLEPLKSHEEAIRDIVARCKQIQDNLGELNDIAVLAGRITKACEAGADPRHLPGIEELERRAAARAEELHGELNGLGGAEARSAFGEAVGELAGQLRARQTVEIERKYVLSAFPREAAAGAARVIVQGWLPGSVLQERLRRTAIEQPGGGSVEILTRTVKAGRGIARVEIEEECERELFEALWPFTDGCRVEKTRYVIEWRGFTWEIDRFSDRELVLAEVELSSPDQEPTPPEWLRRVIVEEVTGDSGYVNRNLAK